MFKLWLQNIKYIFKSYLKLIIHRCRIQEELMLCNSNKYLHTFEYWTKTNFYFISNQYFCQLLWQNQTRMSHKKKQQNRSSYCLKFIWSTCHFSPAKPQAHLQQDHYLDILPRLKSNTQPQQLDISISPMHRSDMTEVVSDSCFLPTALFPPIQAY